jgi:hypothetical protein
VTLKYETRSAIGLAVAAVSISWIWFAVWFILGAMLCGAL